MLSQTKEMQEKKSNILTSANFNVSYYKMQYTVQMGMYSKTQDSLSIREFRNYVCIAYSRDGTNRNFEITSQLLKINKSNSTADDVQICRNSFVTICNFDLENMDYDNRVEFSR